MQYHQVVGGMIGGVDGGKTGFRSKLMIVQNSNEVTFSIGTFSYFFLYPYTFSACSLFLYESY
jgi:hypothetical protein